MMNKMKGFTFLFFVVQLILLFEATPDGNLLTRLRDASPILSISKPDHSSSGTVLLQWWLPQELLSNLRPEGIPFPHSNSLLRDEESPSSTTTTMATMATMATMVRLHSYQLSYQPYPRPNARNAKAGDKEPEWILIGNVSGIPVASSSSTSSSSSSSILVPVHEIQRVFTQVPPGRVLATATSSVPPIPYYFVLSIATPRSNQPGVYSAFDRERSLHTSRIPCTATAQEVEDALNALESLRTSFGPVHVERDSDTSGANSNTFSWRVTFLEGMRMQRSEGNGSSTITPSLSSSSTTQYSSRSLNDIGLTSESHDGANNRGSAYTRSMSGDIPLLHVDEEYFAPGATINSGERVVGVERVRRRSSRGSRSGGGRSDDDDDENDNEIVGQQQQQQQQVCLATHPNPLHASSFRSPSPSGASSTSTDKDLITSSNACEHRVTGLLPGQSYRFRVQAIFTTHGTMGLATTPFTPTAVSSSFIEHKEEENGNGGRFVFSSAPSIPSDVLIVPSTIHDDLRDPNLLAFFIPDAPMVSSLLMLSAEKDDGMRKSSDDNGSAGLSPSSSSSSSSSSFAREELMGAGVTLQITLPYIASLAEDERVQFNNQEPQPYLSLQIQASFHDDHENEEGSYGMPTFKWFSVQQNTRVGPATFIATTTNNEQRGIQLVTVLAHVEGLQYGARYAFRVRGVAQSRGKGSNGAASEGRTSSNNSNNSNINRMSAWSGPLSGVTMMPPPPISPNLKSLRKNDIAHTSVTIRWMEVTNEQRAGQQQGGQPRTTATTTPTATVNIPGGTGPDSDSGSIRHTDAVPVLEWTTQETAAYIVQYRKVTSSLASGSSSVFTDVDGKNRKPTTTRTYVTQGSGRAFEQVSSGSSLLSKPPASLFSFMQYPTTTTTTTTKTTTTPRKPTTDGINDDGWITAIPSPSSTMRDAILTFGGPSPAYKIECVPASIISGTEQQLHESEGANEEQGLGSAEADARKKKILLERPTQPMLEIASALDNENVYVSAIAFKNSNLQQSSSQPPLNASSCQYSFTVTGLLPLTLYQFRVLALSKVHFHQGIEPNARHLGVSTSNTLNDIPVPQESHPTLGVGSEGSSGGGSSSGTDQFLWNIGFPPVPSSRIRTRSIPRNILPSSPSPSPSSSSSSSSTSPPDSSTIAASALHGNGNTGALRSKSSRSMLETFQKQLSPVKGSCTADKSLYEDETSKQGASGRSGGGGASGGANVFGAIIIAGKGYTAPATLDREYTAPVAVGGGGYPLTGNEKDVVEEEEESRSSFYISSRFRNPHGGNGMIVLTAFTEGGEDPVETVIYRYGSSPSTASPQSLAALRKQSVGDTRYTIMLPTFSAVEERETQLHVYTVPPTFLLQKGNAGERPAPVTRVLARAWGAGGGCGARLIRNVSDDGTYSFVPPNATMLDSRTAAAETMDAYFGCVRGGSGAFLRAWLEVKPNQEILVVPGTGGRAGYVKMPSSSSQPDADGSSLTTPVGLGGWPGGGNGGVGIRKSAGGGGGASLVFVLPVSESATGGRIKTQNTLLKNQRLLHHILHTQVPTLVAAGGGGGGASDYGSAWGGEGGACKGTDGATPFLTPRNLDDYTDPLERAASIFARKGGGKRRTGGSNSMDDDITLLETGQHDPLLVTPGSQDPPLPAYQENFDMGYAPESDDSSSASGGGGGGEVLDIGVLVVGGNAGKKGSFQTTGSPSSSYASTSLGEGGGAFGAASVFSTGGGGEHRLEGKGSERSSASGDPQGVVLTVDATHGLWLQGGNGGSGWEGGGGGGGGLVGGGGGGTGIDGAGGGGGASYVHAPALVEKYRLYNLRKTTYSVSASGGEREEDEEDTKIPRPSSLRLLDVNAVSVALSWKQVFWPSATATTRTFAQMNTFTTKNGVLVQVLGEPATSYVLERSFGLDDEHYARVWSGRGMDIAIYDSSNGVGLSRSSNMDDEDGNEDDADYSIFTESSQKRRQFFTILEGLLPLTTYRFRLLAIGVTGNRSLYSDPPLLVRTPNYRLNEWTVHQGLPTNDERDDDLYDGNNQKNGGNSTTTTPTLNSTTNSNNTASSSSSNTGVLPSYPMRKVPPKLRGASTNVIGEYLYIFGGLSIGYECSDGPLSAGCYSAGTGTTGGQVRNETWRLDPFGDSDGYSSDGYSSDASHDAPAWNWYQLPISPLLAPPPRERHMAATIENRLYILGGRSHPDTTRDGGPYLNDMWVLEVDEHSEVKKTTIHEGKTMIESVVVNGNSRSGDSQGSGLSLSCESVNSSSSSSSPAQCGLPELIEPVLLLNVQEAVETINSGNQSNSGNTSSSSTSASATTTTTTTTVAPGSCISSIKVWVEILHPCLQDIEIRLLGPGPPLSWQSRSSAQNLGRTYYSASSESSSTTTPSSTSTADRFGPSTSEGAADRGKTSTNTVRNTTSGTSSPIIPTSATGRNRQQQAVLFRGGDGRGTAAREYACMKGGRINSAYFSYSTETGGSGIDIEDPDISGLGDDDDFIGSDVMDDEDMLLRRLRKQDKSSQIEKSLAVLLGERGIAIFEDDSNTPIQTCCDFEPSLKLSSFVRVYSAAEAAALPPFYMQEEQEEQEEDVSSFASSSWDSSMEFETTTSTTTPASNQPAYVSLLHGRFRPLDPLSIFHGLPAAGIWGLQVVDRKGNNVTGEVRTWGLVLETAPCTPNYVWTRLYPPSPLPASKTSSFTTNATSSFQGSSSAFLASLPALTHIPPPRIDATSVVVGSSWFVWGGHGSTSTNGSPVGASTSYTHPYSRDLWRYDTHTNTWTLLQPSIASWARKQEGSSTTTQSSRDANIDLLLSSSNSNNYLNSLVQTSSMFGPGLYQHAAITSVGVIAWGGLPYSSIANANMASQPGFPSLAQEDTCIYQASTSILHNTTGAYACEHSALQTMVWDFISQRWRRLHPSLPPSVVSGSHGGDRSSSCVGKAWCATPPHLRYTGFTVMGDVGRGRTLQRQGFATTIQTSSKRKASRNEGSTLVVFGGAHVNTGTTFEGIWSLKLSELTALGHPYPNIPQPKYSNNNHENDASKPLVQAYRDRTWKSMCKFILFPESSGSIEWSRRCLRGEIRSNSGEGGNTTDSSNSNESGLVMPDKWHTCTYEDIFMRAWCEREYQGVGMI